MEFSRYEKINEISKFNRRSNGKSKSIYDIHGKAKEKLEVVRAILSRD